MHPLFKYLLIFLFSFTLIACGSSGGGGDDDPEEAEISSKNAEELGTAATEGAKQAVVADNAPTFGARAQNQSVLYSLTESLAKRFSGLYAFEEIDLSSQVCPDGGTAIIVTNFNNQGNGTAVITYEICSLLGAIVDGEVNLESSTSGDTTTLSFEYVDFTVTIGDDVTEIDLSATCTVNTSTADISCTYSSEVLGIDGRTYEITDFSVSGNDTSGYTISATITDPDYGTISITTNTPIMFNCPGDNNQPSAGEIEFTDADGVLVTITYTCDGFTIVYDGNTEVFTW